VLKPYWSYPTIEEPSDLKERVGENNACIPPTLDGWVYIISIHGPLDGPLNTRAQYTPTVTNMIS